MSEEQNVIRTQEAPRSNFTMIPNLVDDLGLDPYAVRLYLHLRRVAGETGECWQSTRTLARHCHMSAGAVSKAKRALADAGLITISEETIHGGVAHVITIVDIWQRNAEASTRSPGEQVSTTCSPHERTRSCGERTRSPGERKNIPIRRTLEEEVVVRENEKVEVVPASQGQRADARPTDTLKPDSPGQRMLFAKLQRAQGDLGRKATRQWRTREQKRRFAEAETALGYDALCQAVDDALARGILSLADMVAYVCAVANRVKCEVEMTRARAAAHAPVETEKPREDPVLVSVARALQAAGRDYLLSGIRVRRDDGRAVAVLSGRARLLLDPRGERIRERILAEVPGLQFTTEEE